MTGARDAVVRRGPGNTPPSAFNAGSRPGPPLGLLPPESERGQQVEYRLHFQFDGSRDVCKDSAVALLSQ